MQEKGLSFGFKRPYLFGLKQNNSNISTEIYAGLTTFMTMAYILAVNPSILSASGMDIGALTVVTAIIAAICSIAMGLYANRPFGLAPAMGANALLAFTIVKGGEASWEVALGMVFISGIIFVILTVCGLRNYAVSFLPKNIKISIAAAVGLFIAQLGFSNAGLFSFSSANLLQLAPLNNPTAILSLLGLIIGLILLALKIKGSLFWTITLITLLGIPFGVTNLPENIISTPPSISPIAFHLDILGALKIEYIPLIFLFFASDFFSTIGTLLGLGTQARLLDINGNLPESEKPMLVDAVGTVIGATLGTSTVTTFVESASGIGQGGRTGLTAIVIGLCFAAMLFFTPLILATPTAATAGVLIIIGILMMEGMSQIEFTDFSEWVPAMIIIIFSAYTFSLALGMTFGILSYVIIKIATGHYKKVSIGMYAMCIPLIYYLYVIAVK